MSTMLARVGERGRLDWGRFRPGFGEEILDAAAEVNECTRDDCADALKDQKAGARIDVSMGLAFKSEAESNEEHQGNRKTF